MVRAPKPLNNLNPNPGNKQRRLTTKEKGMADRGLAVINNWGFFFSCAPLIKGPKTAFVGNYEDANLKKKENCILEVQSPYATSSDLLVVLP